MSDPSENTARLEEVVLSNAAIPSERDIVNGSVGVSNPSNEANFSGDILQEEIERENIASVKSDKNEAKSVEEEQDCSQLNKDFKNNSNDSVSVSRPLWRLLYPCFGCCKKSKKKNESIEISELQETSESDEFACYLNAESEILTPADIRNISHHLPPQAIGFLWKLTFSTSIHGFSLRNLYRKMQEIESPTLVLIQDMKERIFGALVSCPLKLSRRFYGTSHSFLFRFQPDFEVFRCCGKNFYFVYGQRDSLCFGLDDGRFGIWLDEDLNKGRTERCGTYDSPALVEENDFLVKTIECWTFG